MDLLGDGKHNALK